MTFYIRTQDGELLAVRTKVGDGQLTDVEVLPVEQRAPVAMEPGEQE